MAAHAEKREAVAHLETALGMSERRACMVVGVDRTSMVTARAGGMMATRECLRAVLDTSISGRRAVRELET